MEVEIDLTANHYGIFELKLCPNNNPRSEATQDCFDKYPLIVSKTGEKRFVIPPDTEKQAVITYSVRLPRGVTCSVSSRFFDDLYYLFLLHCPKCSI